MTNQTNPKRVSLWGQFVRLAACAVAVFGIVAVIWYGIDSQLAASANRLAASQKRDLFKKLLELQSRDLDAVLDSRAYWSEKNGFLTPQISADPVPLDQKSVWIFDSSWNERFQSAPRALLEDEQNSFRSSLKSASDQVQFFKWNRGRIEEYRARAITDRHRAIQGFVVARANWSPDKLSDLSRITESDASVVPAGQPQPPVTDQGYTVSVPLMGPQGQPEAELRFLVRTDALLFAMNRSRVAGLFLLMLMIGLTSALMATVVRKLVVPLGKLAKGLEEHDTHLANEFKSSSIEIAQLAEAISQSFQQKTELDGLNKTLASTIESLNEANGQLSSYNEALEQRVTERTRDIGQAIETTIFGWSKAMDSRDHETEGHTKRVAEMAQALGVSAGLDQEELRNLRFGALLHDIGKIGIPDSILLKPGKLTDGEFEVMRGHTLLGYEMLKDIPFLEEAVDVVLYHHERWDGAGYPYGLKGEEIPFAARLFAIADVWDALRSDRPYREAWSEDRVREYIQEQSGIQFDPQLVNLFMTLEPLKHPSDRKTQRKAA